MKNKLHLLDLPKSKTYILLNKRYKKVLFDNLFKHFSNSNKAGKFLEIKGYNIKGWKNKDGYVPLEAMIKISAFLRKQGHKFSPDNIENKIVAYKYGEQGRPILNPKFPINFESEEGAILVAALLCDGGINKNGYPLYNNSEHCMRKRVVDSINKLVGKIHTDPSKPNKNNCLFFPKILKSIVVSGLNMQIGDKVINNPQIPEIFLKTKKKEIIGAFLNQAFSDDGTAYISGVHKQGALAYGESTDISKYSKELRKAIKKERLTDYASNLVKGCKILLEKLGIKVNGPYLKQEYTRKKGGIKRTIHSWSIQIQGRENIKKYQKLIGFSIERKNKRVREILSNYKEVDYGTSFKDAWKNVLELERKNKKITPKTFMEKRKCTQEYARFLIKWLRKKGIIKRNGGGINKGIWGCTPYEYKVINHKIDV